MPLNPFVDSNESEISTSLGPRESFYFHLIFWTNHTLFFVSIVVLYNFLADHIGYKNPLLQELDIVGHATKFGSQFCAILSCFIFSKIVYAVSSWCLEMKKIFAWVNRRAGANIISWNTFLGYLVNSISLMMT